MRLVIVESPYAGNIEENIEYAELCVVDCLQRGEAPFVSHLFYTRVLDDGIVQDRELGIEAGLAWGKKADATVVYIDLGISAGMQRGIQRAQAEGRPVEYRSIVAES